MFYLIWPGPELLLLLIGLIALVRWVWRGRKLFPDD